MGSIAPAKSYLRTEFFKDVLTWFWMHEGESIHTATLAARGLKHGKLAEEVKNLMFAFPEMGGVIWQNEMTIARVTGTNGIRAELHLCDRHTTPHAVNNFLVSKTMDDLFAAEMPTQYAAMKVEEQRRAGMSHP